MESNYWRRHTVSRRGLLGSSAVGIAAVGATLLTGCGDTTSTTGTQGTATKERSAGATSSPGTGATAAVAGTPRQGGALSVPDLGIDVPDIDISVTAGGQGDAQWAIDTLMTLDEPVPGQLKQVPQLAVSLEQPDDLTYIYHLRPGVKFQNVKPVNGRAFTASDAQYSLQRMSTNDPRYTRRTWFTNVKSFDVLDPSTLRITMSQPMASLAYLVASPWTGMIAQEQAEADGGQLKSWIGTGPYMVQTLQPNVRIDYQRNPDYWGAPAPYFDTVHVIDITDPNALASAFRAKQVNSITSVAADTVDSFKQQNPDATSYKAPRTGIGIVAMNNRSAPYKDARVRQAVASACDIGGWIDVVVGGAGFRTGAISPAFTTWGLPESQLLYGKQDLANARKLLDAAGVQAADLDASTITIGTIPEFTGASVQLQGDLKQLGVDIKIQPMSAADYTSNLLVKYSYTLASGNEFSPDDPYLLYNKFHTNGSGNYSGYSDPSMDKMLEDQEKEFDLAKRQSIVHDIQKKIMEDVPTFFTYIQWSFSFTQGVTNWRQSAITGNAERWDSRHAWLTQ